MSAKLLYSIADDNPAVQKQLGCMNGIFQLFDRHHFMSSRRISRDTSKPPPEGQGGNHNAETADQKPKKAAPVKNPKAATEKRRNSTDSSRSSVSSSCNSSSFSSAEDARSAKSERVERSSFSQPAEVPITRNSPMHRSNGVGSSVRQPLSNHRDARGVTVRSGNKDESPTLTYIDSPRPMQKPNKAGKPRFSSLQESLGVLPNFRKVRTSADSIEHSRKDSPRLSYDGRETRDGFRSNSRLKEQPRHSLDSKRGSIIASSQVRQSELVVDSPREVGSHRRQSSVVAKLMGLEALPDSMPEPEAVNGIESGEAFDFSRSSPRISNGTARNSHQRENTSQKVNYGASPKKSKPIPRFPLEPAPWKKPEGDQATEAPPNKARSVYGEIEKRLAQLEFKKSGKDLRALKQILEAMQKSKENLDSPKEVESSNISPQLHNGNRGPEQGSNFAAMPRNINCESPSSPTARRSVSPKTSPSSIVIMKPAARKMSNNVPRADERTSPRNSPGRAASMERNIICRDTPKEAVSPRLQKKKFDPLDYSKRRTSQLGTQKSHPGPQDRNQKSRTRSLFLGYDQGSEISGESFSRDLSDRNNSVSLRSDGNLSTSSWEEAEVTSAYRGDTWTRKKASSPLREDVLIRKTQILMAEQPSPISVLDAALYGDESLSPVKMISNAFEGIGELSSDESQWGQEDLKSSSISNELGLTGMLPARRDAGIDSTNPDHRYILEILSASRLLHDLDHGSGSFQLNPPDQLFTRKLFLALEQIKGSDRLSNRLQELPQLKCQDKLQRRLVFDVVNEILVEKLASNRNRNWLGKRRNSHQQLLHGLCSEIDQLQANSLNCSSDEEDDSLRHIIEKDLNNQSAVWADGFGDISAVVLDVERLIFKDLVSEVVSGAAGHVLRARQASYCRQLF